MFQVGDPAWTRCFANWVNLALDDPRAAVVAVDRHGGANPAGSTYPPPGGPSPSPGPSDSDARSTRDRLRELDDLRRDGLLTDAEHDAQRANIISQV